MYKWKDPRVALERVKLIRLFAQGQLPVQVGGELSAGAAQHLQATIAALKPEKIEKKINYSE